jgi:hypothetical protein
MYISILTSKTVDVCYISHGTKEANVGNTRPFAGSHNSKLYSHVRFSTLTHFNIVAIANL